MPFKKISFSPSVYKSFNLDLSGFNDAELLKHYQANNHERRIYGNVDTDVEFLSMRWIRGRGIEIGPGSSPTPLFGNAVTVIADCDADLNFGGEGMDINISVDDKIFPKKMMEKFDFVIASHVLEHCDSFIRALENLILITKKNGIVYIVLPDIEFLNDVKFISNFKFQHHEEEYLNSLVFSDLHDGQYINAVKDGLDDDNPHAKITDEYKKAIRAGVIPQSFRFMSHKHNYNFDGWIDLVLKVKAFLSDNFKIVDMRYGHIRKDCHFVLEKI